MTDGQPSETDWEQWHLDTTGIGDKGALMDRLSETFGLPAWFGRNWDALADCLTDLRPEPGVVLTWSGADDLPEELRRPLEQILQERTASGTTPWRVLRADA